MTCRLPLSSGRNRRGYYRVAGGAGLSPNETQLRCRTVVTCLGRCSRRGGVTPKRLWVGQTWSTKALTTLTHPPSPPSPPPAPGRPRPGNRLKGRGRYPPPLSPLHCLYPKGIPIPPTAFPTASNRPPPTAFTSPATHSATALQPLWDCPDAPPPYPSSNALPSPTTPGRRGLRGGGPREG